jgi:hypothetical protein
LLVLQMVELLVVMKVESSADQTVETLVASTVYT